MATQEDRSLGSGIAIPQWMKNKMNDKFDFDQSAFSPTELDDSFMFHYFHPKSNDTNIIGKPMDSITKIEKKGDFSRHPTPCQKYLMGGTDVTPPPQITPFMTVKSSGTDDGFKGEAAKCGSSIIRVASQMVSGKVIHGFTMQSGECSQPPQPSGGYDLHKRRGSRSLPASPLASPTSSPKANRKVANKYFTGAFTDVDKSKGSWILSNLLAKRDMSQSVGYIGEETKEELERTSSTASIDEAALRTPVFKAKPSELREMNFWSPTSM